jgi:hypothetical protein
MDNNLLIASEGMMLTNGELYVSKVWLGNGDSADNWREVVKSNDIFAEDEGLEVK